MDEKSFYGGVLHVCYVPEYETVEDTRLKLQDRKRYVIRAVQNKGMLYHPIPVYIKRTHKLKLAKYPFNNCVLCFFTFRYALDLFFSYQVLYSKLLYNKKNVTKQATDALLFSSL